MLQRISADRMLSVGGLRWPPPDQTTHPRRYRRLCRYAAIALSSFSLNPFCGGIAADGLRLSGSRTYVRSHLKSRDCPMNDRSGPLGAPSPRMRWHEAHSFSAYRRMPVRTCG